jgi:hypothetical protein
MPHDVWPALGPNGEDDHQKLNMNEDGELITTASGEFTQSGLKTELVDTEVTLNDSSWTLLPNTGALSGRNSILVQNQSTVEIKVTGVGGSTGGYVGFAVAAANSGEAGGWYTTDITDAIALYGRSSSGSAKVLVREIK